jgi:hypothetical protein
MLFGAAVCLLTVLPAAAIIGDASGVGVWDAGCNCYASWQVVSVDPVNQNQTLVFYAVVFPNGDYFITGPVSVFY